MAHVRHSKGSDYIGDQNAIEYMCKNGPESVIELEKWVFHSLVLIMVPSTNVHSVVSQKSLVVSRRRAQQLQQTVQVTLFFIRFTNKTSNIRQLSFLNGTLWIL